MYKFKAKFETKIFKDTYAVHKKQLAHLVSMSIEARSTVWIFLLKADIVGLSLIYFGTMAHILGPI